MDSDLRQTLLTVARMMADARDPWWVIASGAMALHGAAPIAVADVDLLTSVRDADRLLDRLGSAPPPPAGTPRFRSAIFARLAVAPVPIELMADFHVFSDGAWRPIVPATRIPVAIDDAILFIPSIAELIAHCRLFDRPKDRARAALLQRLETEESIRPPFA